MLTWVKTVQLYCFKMKDIISKPACVYMFRLSAYLLPLFSNRLFTQSTSTHLGCCQMGYWHHIAGTCTHQQRHHDAVNVFPVVPHSSPSPLACCPTCSGAYANSVAIAGRKLKGTEAAQATQGAQWGYYPTYGYPSYGYGYYPNYGYPAYYGGNSAYSNAVAYGGYGCVNLWVEQEL